MAFLRNRAVQYLLAIAVVVATLLATAFIRLYVHADGPLAEPRIVLIEDGASVSGAGRILTHDGVIELEPFELKLYHLTYYLFFSGESIKAGEYLFSEKISPYNVLDKMTRGDIYYRSLTIPEGLTTQQILQKVSEAEGLTGEVPGDIAEGELLPETYLYSYGESRADLVKRMYVEAYKLLELKWQTRMEGLPFKDKNEVLTLASIVEKEAANDEERPIIASVYINRLKKGMRLQADPTVAYAITGGKSEMDRELTRKDLNTVDSPYNTYRYKGLPPGPICNPGWQSINAVVFPNNTDYLYFVADGNGGGHNFSRTLAEHERNVRAYRKQKKIDQSVRTN